MVLCIPNKEQGVRSFTAQPVVGEGFDQTIKVQGPFKISKPSCKVAELGPVCKSWKISIEPKVRGIVGFLRWLMALLLHGSPKHQEGGA